MAGPADWLAGGRVGRPHGLDGSFHVVAARPALLDLGVVARAGDLEAEIVRRAGTDERPIVRLAGVESREAAEALRGLELLVPRGVAPALEDDEWWAEDLEGCLVVDGDRELGRVARLVPLPSCEALEVTGAGEEFLVPLVRDAVRLVDVRAKVIDVDVAFLGDTAPASARGDDAGAGLSETPDPRDAPELGAGPDLRVAADTGAGSDLGAAPDPGAASDASGPDAAAPPVATTPPETR